MIVLNSIRTFVAEGKLDKGLSLLLTQYKEHQLKDDVVLINARYSSLKEKNSKGLYTNEEVAINENKISYSLLNLLNEIELVHANDSVSEVEVNLDEMVVAEKLLEILNESFAGFKSQSNLRNSLYFKMRKRLEVKETLEYEAFFQTYYPQMNENEKAFHLSIRDYTEKILNKYNRKALELLLGKNILKDELPKLLELERHLLVWLGKYERLFKASSAMNILYVGVVEKVPFPVGVEQDIEEYIKRNGATK